MIKTPLFIVFEGIDGCGKTTQLKLLSYYLSTFTDNIIRLKEPTNGLYGLQLRDMLQSQKEINQNELLDLFIKDREDDINKNILPALNENFIVLLDRYYFSNAAYQAESLNDIDNILNLNMAKNFPKPDIVFFIDTPPELAIQRMVSNRNKLEIFEKEHILRKVQSNFHYMIEKYSDEFLFSPIECDTFMTTITNTIIKQLNTHFVKK